MTTRASLPFALKPSAIASPAAAVAHFVDAVAFAAASMIAVLPRQPLASSRARVLAASLFSEAQTHKTPLDACA